MIPGSDKPLVDLDSKVHQIGSVESAWNSPALPDEVKLDLATSPHFSDSRDLADFLHGVDGDLATAESTFGQIASTPQPAPAPEPVPSAITPAFPTIEPDDPNSTISRIRRTLNSIAGYRAPEVLSNQGVRDLKVRAVKAGLLPEDADVNDPKWSPEMNRVRGELFDDTFRKNLGGSRPGALSVGRVLKSFDEWLSPSGLLSAAVAADFLPDIEQISEEASGWGAKFKRWAKNPLSIRDAVDALTGPLDDIAVPILNDALLFTGVGDVWHFARGAQALGRAGTVATIGDMWATIGKAAPLVDDLNAVKTGFLARKFQQSGVAGISGAGKLMEAWRRRTDVVVAKKAVQGGMKLGLASKAEATLFPNTEHAQRVEDYQNFRATNPIAGGVSMLGDIAFGPSHLFRPGGISEKTATAYQALVQQRIKVASGSRATIEFAEGLREALRADPERADDLARLESAWKQHGPSGALVSLYGDREKVGGMVNTVAVSAALDYHARMDARDALGSLARTVLDPAENDPVGFREHLLFFRNKHLNQLRQVALPETDEDWVDYAKVYAGVTARNPRGRKGVLEKALGSLFAEDPAERLAARETAESWIEHHNKLAQGHLNKLLDTLDPGFVRTYTQQVAPTLANWDTYNASLLDLHEAEANGLLQEVQQVQPFYDLESNPWPADLRNRFSQDLHYALLNPEEVPKAKGWLSPFSEPIDPFNGRYTLARLGTVTKQKAAEIVNQVEYLRERQKALKLLDDVPELYDGFVIPLRNKATEAGIELGQAPNHTLIEWVKGLTPAPPAGIPKKKMQELAKAVRWAERNRVDAREAYRLVDDDLRAFEQADFWTDPGLGIPHFKGNGQVTSLDERVASLRKQGRFLASEVELPEELAQSLGARGYKAVHGVDFMFPHDLLHLDGPFTEATKRDWRRLTFGNFLDRHGYGVVDNLRQRRFRTEVIAALKPLQKAGKVPSYMDLTSPESEDVSWLINRLYDHRNEMQVLAQDVRHSMEGAPLLPRLVANATNQIIPINIYDMEPSFVARALSEFDPAAQKAVTGALRRARSIGWEYQGLTGIEAYLRGNSPVTSMLRVLGRTEAGEKLSAAGRLKSEVMPGKLAGRFAAGAVASTAAGAAGGDEQDRAIAGLTGAAIGPSGLAMAGKLAAPAAKKLDTLFSERGLFQYGRMADDLSRLRDYLRFSLSPFFDLRRYTEGWVMSQAQEVPDGVNIPFLNGMKAYKKAATQHGWRSPDEVLSGFRAAAHGDFDWDEIEATSRWFTDQGILGFNPTDKMAAAFGFLTSQRMDPGEAYKIAKNIYTYGTRGRSGLELSANFLFFPFSAEKHVKGTVLRFLGNDLGRAFFIHDALKTYEILNERYDLSEYWQDHMPLLRQLQKINEFGHGFSPGELGGINRIFIDAAMETPVGDLAHGVIDPVLNVFLPQAVTIRGSDDGVNIRKLVSRLAPVFNDMDRLIADTAEQGHVVFSPQHKTKRAETEAAWNEWNEFRDGVDQLAREQHLEKGWTSVVRSRSPEMQPWRDMVDLKRMEIADKYPGWRESFADSAANAIRRENELDLVLTHALADEKPQLGHQLLFNFNEELKQIREYLKTQNMSFETNPDDIPGEIWQLIRDMAVQYSLQPGGDDFVSLYRRYFQREFGPITRELAY